MLLRSPAWVLSILIIGSLPLAISATSSAQAIKSGPPACPGVALTFDLCPVIKGSGYDQALMDYLIEHRIPSTLFMSGKWMAKHKEQVNHLLGLGLFEIGTHGDVHAHLPMHNAGEQGPKFSARSPCCMSTMPIQPRCFALPMENITT